MTEVTYTRHGRIARIHMHPPAARFGRETRRELNAALLRYKDDDAQTLELGPNPYASTDRIEGTRAFVENRRPVWQNK